jgi:hypothetical protein
MYNTKVSLLSPCTRENYRNSGLPIMPTACKKPSLSLLRSLTGMTFSISFSGMAKDITKYGYRGVYCALKVSTQ